ncbi:MAG: DUF4376 domain-containing protein [Minisyncoccota bacterium]
MPNYYHPQTLEHIRTPLPAVADWAGATEIEPPPYDPQLESCRMVDGAWLIEATGPSMAAAVATRKGELAALRYTKEVSGLVLPNGMGVATDDRSKTLIAGAMVDAMANPTALTDWKADTGWIQIDGATVALISSAVALHVRACFSAERGHAEAIDAIAADPAKTGADIQAYDLTTGWPG